MALPYRHAVSPSSIVISQEQIFTCCKFWRGILPLDLTAIRTACEVTNAQAIAVLGSMLTNKSFVTDLINSNPATPEEPAQPEAIVTPHHLPQPTAAPQSASHTGDEGKLAGLPLADS